MDIVIERRSEWLKAMRIVAIVALAILLSRSAVAQTATANKTAPSSNSDQKVAPSDGATEDFPPELVKWTPLAGNPIFTAEGPGHWDVKIRERGWVLRDGDHYQLWFTGYTGGRDDIKMLGYATSSDGIHWTRS